MLCIRLWGKGLALRLPIFLKELFKVTATKVAIGAIHEAAAISENTSFYLKFMAATRASIPLH